MACPHCSELARQLREAMETIAEYEHGELVAIASPDDVATRRLADVLFKGVPQSTGGSLAAARLLHALMARPGHIFVRESLVPIVSVKDDVNTKIVDVILCRLRKGLRTRGFPDAVETVWGTGIRLRPEAAREIGETLIP